MRLFNRKGKGAQSQGSPKPPQPPQPPPPLGYAPPHTSSFQQPAEPFKPLPTLDVSLELPDLPSTSIVFDQPSQPATQPDPAPEQSLAELNALATMQQAPSRKNTVQSDYDFLLNIEESLDPIDPKAMLEMQLREQFGRPHSNTIGSSNGGGDYQVAMAPVEPPGQFAPEPAQPRPLVHPLVQAQAQPMVQVQARVQPMVPPPAARKPVAVSAAAAMAQHATTVSGNNAMEATDVIERQFAISRSSRGSSSPTSSDEEAMVTLTKQAATMTLTSGKPEPSSDPNRKITDRAANIQRMREASAMGKNMAFGMVHTGNGAGGFGGNADDESDSVPLGGLRRAAGTTTGQQSGSATAMIPQQAYGAPTQTHSTEPGHIKMLRQQQMQQLALQFNPQPIANPQSLTNQMQSHPSMQHPALLSMPLNHPHMTAQMNMYQAQQAVMAAQGQLLPHQQSQKASPTSQKSHRQPAVDRLSQTESQQVPVEQGLEQLSEAKPTEECESQSLASALAQDQQQLPLSGPQTPRQVSQQLPHQVLMQQQQQQQQMLMAAAAGNPMVGSSTGSRAYPGTPNMTPGRQLPNTILTPQMQASPISPMYNARTPIGPHMVLMNSNGQRVNGSSSTSALYNNVGLAQMASMMEHPGKLSQQLQQQHMQQFYAQNGIPMGIHQPGGPQFAQSPVIQGDPRTMQLNGMMGQVGVGPNGTPVLAPKTLNITPATNHQSLMSFIPNLPMTAKGSMAKNPLMRDLSKMKRFSTSDYATRPTLLAEADSRKVAKKAIPGLGGSSSHSFQPDMAQAQKQLLYLQQQLQIQQQQLQGQMEPQTPPSQPQQTPRQQHQREPNRGGRHDTPNQGSPSGHALQKNHGGLSVSSSTSYIDPERYTSKGGEHRGHTRRPHGGNAHRHPTYSSEYDEADHHRQREFRQRTSPYQSKSRKLLARARRRSQHNDDYYDYYDYDDEEPYRSDYYDEYDDREYDARHYDERDDNYRSRRGGNHRRYQDRPPTSRRGREREARAGNRHRVPSQERAGGRDEVPGPVKRIIGELEDPRDKKGSGRGERRHYRQEYASESDDSEPERKGKAKTKSKAKTKETTKEKAKAKTNAAAKTSIDSTKTRSPLLRAMASIKRSRSGSASPRSAASLSPASICKSVFSSASSTRKDAGGDGVDKDEQESDDDSESDDAETNSTPSTKAGSRNRSLKNAGAPKKPRPISMVTEWTESVRKPLPTPTPPGRKVSCASKSAVVAI